MPALPTNDRSDQSAIVVTTAADTGYFKMFQGMLDSLRRFEVGRTLDVRSFDLGLKPDERSWLENEGVVFAEPRWHQGIQDGMMPKFHLAETVRPHVREYFPGYEHYMWLDPDLWLQDSGVLERLIQGSKTEGAAIAHEADSVYKFQAWHFGWCLKHRILGMGLADGMLMMVKPALNCGVYCMAADAPHWDAWATRLERAVKRTNRVAPHSQFTFNQVVYVDRFPTRILDSADNWICDRAPPVWDEERQVYCKPYAPYQPISLLHLAGPAKRERYTIKTTSGGERRDVSLHYPEKVKLAAA
ncbi:MAG: hypothetical protein AAFO01_08475 [Pseudomonadota bacterium]